MLKVLDIHVKTLDITEDNSNENLFKKQLPDVLYKNVFLFSKIHRKTPVPECLFNKISSLRPATLFKRDSGQGVFL